MSESSNQKKSDGILLVSDIRNHAFDHIADGVSQGFNVEKIFAKDFSSPRKLARAIRKSTASNVHFFWRKTLENLLHEFGTSLRTLLGDKTVSFSIPDHLYSDLSSLSILKPVFDFADGYCVTSVELLDKYSKQNVVKKPLSLVHDFIGLPANSRVRTASYPQSPMRLIWVGNSRWGEWEGAEDHKGLKTVILPAIELARAQGVAVELDIIDSAHSRTPHTSVVERMLAADFIVQASKHEGTGLPIIEAMGTGAIPISTNVGVAPELMTGELSKFLIERNAESLSNILLWLWKHPELVSPLSISSFRKVVDKFTLDLLNEEWSEFLEKLSISQKNRKPDPAQRWDSSPLILRIFRSTPILIRSIAPLYNRFSVVRNLGNYFLEIASQRILMRLIDSDSTKVEKLAVHHPNWHGVKASTIQLFSSTFPIPLPDLPELHTQRIVNLYAKIIANKATKEVIFSGGDAFHRDVAKALSEHRPDLALSLLWHGSPTLFSAGHEGFHFREWLKLAREGIISEFNVLKIGLSPYLQGQGIKSQTLQNMVPVELQHAKGAKFSDSDGKVHIGVLASSSAWWKNLDAQVLAASMVENSIIHVVNIDKHGYLLDLVESGRIINHPGPMEHDEFLNLIGKLDVVTYVTVTEASPMIPLEAMSRGVPVLLGASVEYSDFPEKLKVFKTRSLDNLDEIRSCLETVLDNKNLIINEQLNFIIEKKVSQF